MDQTQDRQADEVSGAPSQRSAIFIVFLVIFIDLLGFGIVIPLLPLYATTFFEPLFPGESSRVLRGVMLGLLMSSFSAMQFVFAPVWGRLSDRIGRRPILLLGLGGSVFFYTLFGVASELGAQGMVLLGVVLLFVFRLGGGVAGATISTAQAVIADCTTPDKRARGMALIGAAFGIGFTFGPLLGFASLFVDFEGAPGFAAAGFSLVALTLAWLRLPETLRPGGSSGARHWFDWRSTVGALRTPTLGLLITTFFLATFAFGGLESTLALVNKFLLTGYVEAHIETTKEALKTTERTNFLIFAYVGFVLVMAQGLYRGLVQRVGEARFLKLGLVLMAIGLLGGVGVLFMHVPGKPGLIGAALAVFTLTVLGFAFVTPSIQSLISRRTDPQRQGEVLGVNQSGSALARILGPMFFVTLFFLTTNHVLPYLCGAILLILVFVWSLRIRQD